MKKRLYGWFLTLTAMAMIIAVGFGMKKQASADGGEHENHCICGGNCESATVANGHTCMETAPVWVAVGTEEEIRTTVETGSTYTEKTDLNIYLTADVQIVGSYFKVGDNLNLSVCLNGHRITASQNSKVFYCTSSKNITLNICDCSKNENSGLFGKANSGINSNSGGLIYTASTTKLNLFGVRLSGGTARYGGCLYTTTSTVKIYDTEIMNGISAQYGGNVYMTATNASFYHCQIHDGIVQENDSYPSTSYYGGNVALASTSTTTQTAINIYDSVIRDGHIEILQDAHSASTPFGGNVAVINNSDKAAFTVNIQNCEISNGYVKTVLSTAVENNPKKYPKGGNIMQAGTQSTLNITGCTVTKGYTEYKYKGSTGSWSAGGNLYTAGHCTIEDSLFVGSVANKSSAEGVQMTKSGNCTLNVTNTVFDGGKGANTAPIKIGAGTAVFDSVVVKNTYPAKGHGQIDVYFTDQTAASLKLIDCDIYASQGASDRVTSGVYLDAENGELILSGSTKIHGNYQENLNYVKGSLVIEDGLNGDAYIGVTLGTDITGFADSDTDYSQCFFADDTSKQVEYDSANQYHILTAAGALPVHQHCICGGNCSVFTDTTEAGHATAVTKHTCTTGTDSPIWLPISSAAEYKTALSTVVNVAQYFYLTKDITLLESVSCAGGNDIHFCLNGHRIIGMKDKRVGTISINTTSGAVAYLSICDCVGGGEILANNSPEGMSTQQGGTFMVYGGNFTLYGGTIKNGNNGNNSTGGGNIAVVYQKYNSSQSTRYGRMYMFGGCIRDGYSQTNAGNLGLAAGCNFELYGGSIINGQSAGVGGNIASQVNNGKIFIYGGSVQDGNAQTNGGNVYLAATSQFKFAGGLISGGTSGSNGGNICFENTGTNEITGGVISGGNKVNVYVASGTTLNMTGGEIHDGSGNNGYNLRVDGTANISGTADITGNANHDTNNAVSAQESSGKINISGGTFDGVVQAVNGDIEITGGTFNCSVESRFSTASITISGGTFNNTVRTGNSKTAQNGSGTLDISGGVFNGAVSLTEKGDITITDGWFAEAPTKTASATGGVLAISGGYYVNAPANQYIASEHEAFEEENTHESVTYHYVVDGLVILTTTSEAAEGDLAYVALLQGGGQVRKGSAVEITASEASNSNYTFQGWYDGETLLSAEKSYTLTNITESKALVAVYQYGGEEVDFAVFVDSGADNSLQVKIGNEEYGVSVKDYFDENIKAGTQVTVNYVGGGTFIAWQNNIGKFMSQSAEYTFTLGSNVELEALYTEGNETKKVAFLNPNNQILKLDTWTNGTSTIETFAPTAPARVGKAFAGWYLGGEPATDAAINESTDKYISIYAKYTATDDTYTVTVKKATVTDAAFTGWTEAEGTLTTKTQALANSAQITVDATDGELQFLCFKTEENGNVLSYQNELTIHGATDMTIYAVYGPTVVEEKATITMTSVTVLNGTGVSFEVTRSIPEDCELIEQGVLMAANLTDATTAKTTLVIDGGENVKKFVSSGTEKQGVTALNVARIGSATIFARGYAVYKKGDVTAIIYTDVAHGTTAGFTVE